MGRRTLFGLHRKVPAPCLAIASSPYIAAEWTCEGTSWCMKSLASWSGVRSRAQGFAYTSKSPNSYVWSFTLLLPWCLWWKILCAPLQSHLLHCLRYHPLLTNEGLASAINPVFSEPSMFPLATRYSITPMSTQRRPDVSHLKRSSLAPTLPSSCRATLCSPFTPKCLWRAVYTLSISASSPPF